MGVSRGVHYTDVGFIFVSSNDRLVMGAGLLMVICGRGCDPEVEFRLALPSVRLTQGIHSCQPRAWRSSVVFQSDCLVPRSPENFLL